MQNYKLIIISGALLILGGSYFLLNLSQEIVLIESEESKNMHLKSVYNQIKWIPSKNQDVWMMNQSQVGRYPHKEQWERIAIVIDKTKKPMTAKYYQLKPGPLEWNNSLIKNQVSFRASCFTCHSNGPRAIRPVYLSTKAPLSISKKLQVQLLNLRIKTYGRIKFNEDHLKTDLIIYPPFRYSQPWDLERLNIKTCNYCHKENGFFARGELVRQQSGTIQSMVEKGHMPPKGFSLSLNEKKQLRDFLKGF
ncbi:MAG: hypothetical protein HOP07_10445 [Bacteriovoracaceae bacterium]|nr:hypothetical protein [Bacteriovoracaceae bacterium]